MERYQYFLFLSGGQNTVCFFSCLFLWTWSVATNIYPIQPHWKQPNFPLNLKNTLTMILALSIQTPFTRERLRLRTVNFSKKYSVHTHSIHWTCPFTRDRRKRCSTYARPVSGAAAVTKYTKSSEEAPGAWLTWLPFCLFSAVDGVCSCCTSLR